MLQTHCKNISMMFKQLPTMISELNKLGIALKALDGINLVSVGVNTGNLDAYRNAIKGLSTEQAVFALASKGATEEQIRQILITEQSKAADVEAALAKAGLTTATAALNGQEVIELAQRKGLTAERAKEIASNLGLIATEEGQVVSKKQLTVATLKQAGATDAEIASILGLNTAETANIGITNVLTGAVAKLWAVITAHPIGAILTAVGAVAIGVIAYINKSNKDAQKAIVETHEKAQQALDDTKTELSDDKSELESVNSELETTKQKIQDIASQDSITLTEQNELDKLSTANTQLEIQKSLLENNIKLKQKSAALDAKNLLDTQVEMNYSDIQDDADVVSHKESYTYAEHAKHEAFNLKNAYNIYMAALRKGDVEKQKLAQDLIDKAGGDTAELTSSLLKIVEFFKYDDGTIIDGYEDLYNQYMGLIYNLQSLTNPDMFLDITKQATQGTNIDYEKAISDGYAMAYDGEFDIDTLNQDFVKALADNGIDKSTIEYIFKLKQQEYQSVVDKIDSKYKVATEIPDTVMVKQDTWNTDGSMTSEYVEIDVDEETRKHIMEVNKINQTLNDYAKENPIEFELLTSYDENFTELDKIIEEERLKADNAIQDTKSQLEDLSKNGNVNLTIRPVIDSSAMQAAGWDVEDGSIATTFTQGEFIWQGDEENGQYVYVHYTPILPDGTVLTPDQLSDYLYGMLEGSQNILDADDKGLVLKVDTDLQGISEDDIKALQEDGKQSAKMSNFLSQMGQWDDSLHDVQEDYYLTGNSVDYVTKAVDKLISKIKDKTFDTSEHSLSDIFELKTDDNTLTSLGKISEEIDKIQTAAKGLKEAMDTYNATGVISIDQLQSILSYGDEYLKYITDENGNLVLNEQAIKNVTQARLEELRAKTLENLLSNLENIDNEATAQAYLKSQVLETAQSYEDLAVAEIQAWQAEMLAKSEKGETDLTVATINEVTEGYIRQANAINNLFNNTNLASVFETSTSASKDTETALDRITKKYKELTDIIGSNVNLILSQIKLLEAQGKEVGSAYYTELVDQSSAKIAVLTEQFNELRKEFLNTPKGTDEWLELNSSILEVQNSIIEAKTNMAEYQKTLDNMKWDRAEKTFNALSDTISSNADLLEAEINRIEANGERVGKVFYAGLIGTVEKNITILTDRHKTLMEQLSTVEEGSDEWIELNKSIFDCQKSIIEAQKSLAEYNKTLNDIDWEKYQTIFENSTDIVSNYKNGIQAQIDIAETQGKEVGKAYYEALISATETENDIYINRRQELLNQLGTVNEGSDEWLEIKSSIADIDQSILDCRKDLIEYQKTLKDIDFERSTEKYNAVKDVISANENLIQAQISQIESAGGSVGKAFYEALISNAEKSIQTETKRLSELQERLLNLDEGSEEWNSLNTEILEVQSSILNAKEKIEGFQNSIDQLHWNTVDDIADAINRISDEAGNIIDLLDTDTVLDDNGFLAKDAITALAMYGEQLETAQYLINKYSKEIEYLNGEYIKGTITVEEYNSKMQDLNDKQWESVDAYNAAKKAIIELRKKAIEEEIDALEELYDARKKAWEQEKDQHDWEKTVSENETNINKLKAQIAELQNDNSLAGIKKRKELEDELKKTESDWEDTLYDHVYDERQDQLDKELEDKKKALEKTLDDEEKLVADSIDLVNKNCSTVLDNLTGLSKKYGIQISNSITEGFKDGENALSSYSSKFTVAHSKFTSQLEITEKKVCDVQSQADATAKSLIDMFNSTNGTLDTQLDITSGKINQAHIDADNAANAFLAMLQTQDGTLGQQIDNVRNKIEISYKTADEASLHFYQMLTAKNGTLDNQIDNTRSKIQDMYMTADTASQHIVNMFKSTNGTLGEQLSKTREAIQAIIDKANEANNALKNAGIGNGADSTPTLTPTGHESDSGLGSTTHDNSGTTLPNAGTWKNADQDIAKDKAIDKIVQVEEKKKNQGSSKSTIGGGSKSKFTTISMGYASGTKSATKGLHPIYEDGVEIIEKDGCLIYPIGAFDGGEKVFNNEQTQRLWELSQNPDVMEKFRQELLNIKPCIDFKFGNTAPVTKTNQNVNVQQHFDALVKVEGDMTPDVYKQLATDKRIDSLLEGKTFKYLANAYNTRGYKL